MIRLFPQKHQKVLALSIPAAINSLLDMLQVMTDLVMVGSISAYAIAAVGLGLQSLMFIFAVLTMLHVGTSALLSRFVGAKSYHKASLGLATLLRFAFIVSIPMMAGWYFGASYIYQLLGTSKEVASLGHEYVGVLSYMMPFIFLKLVFVSALNASGDTKTPMKIKTISIVLNIILNYILIFGAFGCKAFGVEGAAISTVMVNAFEFGVYIWLYLKGKTIYVPNLRFNQNLLKRALKVGIPSSIERSLTFGSFMLFTAIITHYGTSALAGYQIGLRIEGLAFMPGMGFTIAAMALMGQGLGAKKPQQSYEDVLLVLKYASALMFGLSFFMIFTPHILVRVFTDNKDVIDEASLYLRVVGLSQIPLAFSFVLSGALRGAGDSKIVLKINLISLWLIRIIPAFVLTWYFHNIIFVYLAMIADTSIKAIWLWRRFESGSWQKIRV
jgi:putative MATE family efflux protein